MASTTKPPSTYFDQFSDADTLPSVTITPLDEGFAKKINSFTLSDQAIETKVLEEILEKTHVQRSHNDVNRLVRFFNEYINNEGNVDPELYLQEDTGDKPPGTKTMPTIFPTKLCGILGHPGTGKSNSMGKFTAGHETATFTGSTNINTANQQKTTESYAMPNSYDPNANMSSRTLFQLNKIKLSKPEVEKTFQGVTADKNMVEACNAVYDPDSPFMANATTFHQDSVNKEWCKYLKRELKGIFPLFMLCKEEFDKDYLKIGKYVRRCLPKSHPHHQPIPNRLPIIIEEGIQQRYTAREISIAKRRGITLLPLEEENTDLHAHANVMSHEKYVKLLMTNLDLINNAMGGAFYARGKGTGNLGAGLSNKSFKSVINQITHTEFVVDEAGLSYGFLLTLTEMLIAYNALLYNTVPLYTREFTIFLNGSFTQGKAAGDFPYSTLEQVNAVSSQTNRCTSVVSILNRRRTNDADDPVAVLHNSLILHAEFNIPMSSQTYEILSYQEVSKNRMYDTNYRMDSLRLFQKHDTCDKMLKAAHRDGMARVRVKDTILASTRIVYLDTETNNMHYNRDAMENLDQYPHGTNKFHLSTLTPFEARRNITRAFLGFYKEHEFNNTYSDDYNFVPEDCNDEEIEEFIDLIRNEENPTNLTDTFGFFNTKLEKIIQDRTRQTDEICMKKRERLRMQNKKRKFCDIEEMERQTVPMATEDDSTLEDFLSGGEGNGADGEPKPHERIIRTQGLCHIIGPACKLLHTAQHEELRRNCRVLEKNLKDSELFDSSAAQNQRGQNTKTKTKWYSKDDFANSAGGNSAGAYNQKSSSQKESAWFYNPELDMVRVIAMPDFKLLSTTESWEDNLKMFEDTIQRSIADMQMYLAYQRVRHLKENGMTTSTLLFTNTANKGVKTSLDKLLTDRLFENTNDAYKVCVFSTYVEEAYAWLLKKYEQEMMNDRILNEMKTYNQLPQQQQHQYTDFNSLSFKEQYNTDEYKEIRDRIPANVSHIFAVYRELLQFAEYDITEMFKKRNLRKTLKKNQVPNQEVSKQENDDTKQEVSSTSSDKNITSPHSTNVSAVNATKSSTDNMSAVTSEQIENPGDKLLQNVIQHRNIPVEAYPTAMLSDYYFTHLQRLVQKILSDDCFIGFIAKVLSVYVERSVLFTLFRHIVVEERFPISSTMSPGSLVLLGNGYHEACEGDIISERKGLEPVTEMYQKHLMSCEKWLQDGASRTNAKFAPFTMMQANEDGYRRWHPKIFRDSVTTYHAYDIFILTTIPTCDNRTKYEYVFNGFTGNRIKESIIRKAEPKKILFGYYTRHNEPNRNEKKNLFHKTLRTPYARGFNYSVDAESYTTLSSHTKSCVTDMIVKSAYQTYPVYINPGSTAAFLDEQNANDMHVKKNDSDAMYAIRADGVPAFVSTITPIQGLTLSCMMMNDFGDLDTDYVMMLLSRASDVHKVRVSGVSTAKRRLLMPDSINPVGGSKSDSRKDYLRFFNDPHSLRKKRKITKTRNFNMIYRP